MSKLPFLLLVLLVACNDMPAPSGTSDGEILSAYHGLDALPAGAALICPGASGEDGMPVVFSRRLLDVDPTFFEVVTSDGERVTPVCATLRPAAERLERRTVLLAGPFGTRTMSPRSVAVVGPLQDAMGSLLGARIDEVTPLSAGPQLVLAERFLPTTDGLTGECPEETQQVVQLTFAGGVTGPAGAPLSLAQRNGVQVTLESGEVVTPIALADDDPDNHVHACIAETSPARSVAVAAGLFHDPGDDPNPDTQIEVIQGVE